MPIPRVIPVLQLKGRGLVKTKKFSNSVYVGDPLNAVKIFNEKEVDEIVIVDIEATQKGYKPRFDYLQDIVSECFMPVSYGGGVTSIEDIRTLNKIGVEKVILNSIAVQKPDFVKAAAERFGSSTIVVSIDVKKNLFGKQEVYSRSGTQNGKKDPVEFALMMQEYGAGEVLLHSIDRDGIMGGYDIDLIRKTADRLSIPLIACGGAGSIQDFKNAIHSAGASAVAAGSMFVFHGKHKAVLISYPTRKELEQLQTNEY